MKLKRPLYGPDDPRGPSRGRDVVAIKRGLSKVETNFFPRPPTGFDDVANRKFFNAVDTLRLIDSRPPGLRFRQDDLDAVWPYMDAYARLMYRLYIPKSKVPNLGPVWRGGKSILEHDLTHATAGIAFYPAFDDGWRAGRAIIAPEDLTVTEQSGSLGGDAFYAKGASKLSYWVGHVASVPATGRTFRKGETMAVIANIPQSQGGPHVHVGVDARALIGRQLEHRTDYRHGAPTVGEQLKEALT